MSVFTPSDEAKAANNVFSMIDHIEQYGSEEIKTYMLDDKMWFRAKDVAIILGYKDPKKSVSKCVDSEDRVDLQKLIGGTLSPPANLTLNELNTIYINEPGLYSLITSCQLEAGKLFKRWVIKELLPKIRKIGQENAMHALEEKEAIITKMAAEKAEMAIEYDQLKKSAEHQVRGFSQITSFIENSKVRGTNQRIYILFNRLDAAANVFKVGGCASQELLRARLSTYNSSQANDNLYSFAAVWPCHNFSHVEARIKQILGEFRQQNKAEVYLMHYTCLHRIIDFIVNHYNEENEETNLFIRDMVATMTKLEPVIPEAIVIDQPMAAPATRIPSLDLLESREQKAVVQGVVNRFRGNGAAEIKRSEFEAALNIVVLHYKKRPAWKLLKELAADIRLVYSM